MVGDEVLYDDVSHVVSVGVAVFVQAVHYAKDEMVVGNGTVLTTHGLQTYAE